MQRNGSGRRRLFRCESLEGRREHILDKKITKNRVRRSRVDKEQ